MPSASHKITKFAILPMILQEMIKEKLPKVVFSLLHLVADLHFA